MSRPALLDKLFQTGKTLFKPALIPVDNTTIKAVDDKLAVQKATATTIGGVKISGEDGLVMKSDGSAAVDFDAMPTDKFETMLKSIRVPIWLTGNKSFYVNQATGSDTLDAGRGESESKPFKTIQACVNYVCENYNISSHTLTIYIEPPYDDLSDLELPSYSASTGAIRIVSKSADPSQCKIRRAYLSFAVPYYLWNITARAYTISSGRYGCFHASKGQLNLQNCVADMTNANISGGAFSACYAATYGEIRIWALSGSQTDYFNVPGIKIIGDSEHSFDCIFNADSGGLISFAADITIEGSCNITAAFSAASNLSMILWIYSSLAIPGRAPVITISENSSVSGKRYSSGGNSIVTARGQGAEAYPGSITGTTANGGQYY